MHKPSLVFRRFFPEVKSGLRIRVRRPATVLQTLLVAWLVVAAPALAQNKTSGITFHGTYEGLQPNQKKLVDQWYAEYNKAAREQLSPMGYNQLPVSTRTTFEAVTHALSTTNLTDASGKSTGNALQIVQAIETVNGKVPKASGDQQFRIYVQLTPHAVEMLKQNKQFYRDRDNTVFHQGYPTNYRQGGGMPSIQVSISKDGKHADIDVDYRSPKFPAGLFNGHLTSANSDVRAGDNTRRHERRWVGLTDWWRNLFGLMSEQDEMVVTMKEGEVPAQPRKSTGSVAEATQDFLAAWLLEQKPEIAAAYLSPVSFSCLTEYGPQAGTEINVGVAPYAAVKDLAETLAAVGKINGLQDAVTAYPMQSSAFAPAKQLKDAVFALAQVTNRAATEMFCDSQRAYDEFDRFRTAGTLDKFGGYYASSFRLLVPNGASDGITLLWAKENKNWKIVAWELESEARKPKTLPDTRQAAVVAASRPASEAGVVMQATPGFLEAASGFFQMWLMKEDFPKAATYFSPDCYRCIALYLADGETPPKSAAEQALYIRNTLAYVGKEIGTIHRLKGAIEAVTPQHEGLRVVSHSDEAAYAVVAIPDYLAQAFDCAKRSADNPYQPTVSEAPVYGTYYGVVFALRTPGEHSAVVSMLWRKQERQWRIVAYDIAN